MTVHSFITSSNERLPRGGWLAIWTGVTVLFLSCVLFFELDLRYQGWSPSVNDSGELWSYYRKRAAELGNNAIILVGKSRIQVGADLDEIRSITKLEPVQLAIDGTTPVPVMENLANDPRITGTIILELTENDIQRDYSNNKATEWIAYYEHVYVKGSKIEPYRVIDRNIGTLLEKFLVTRIEGAKPYTVISSLIFNKKEFINYLVLHPDRSRDADYGKVKMPDFYAARVVRQFGKNLFGQQVIPYEVFLEVYSRAVAELKPLDNSVFLQGIKELLEYVHKIESRGGRVIIVRFPTDKLIREIDHKRYPRQLYWDQLAKQHDQTKHSEDYLALSTYDLPDGSHLDFRDKKRFTHELIKIIYKM
jgi:hypothetical protein